MRNWSKFHLLKVVKQKIDFRIILKDIWTGIFHDNLTLPKSTQKCWLEQGLNSYVRDTGLPLFLLSYRVHRDCRRAFIQLKCTRYSRDNLTLIHERVCNVSTLVSESWSSIKSLAIRLYAPEISFPNPPLVENTSGVKERYSTSLNLPPCSLFFACSCFLYRAWMLVLR